MKSSNLLRPLLPGILFFVVSGASAQGIDYQKAADGSRFQWKNEESTILHSMEQMDHEYTFRFDYIPAKHEMTLSFLKDGEPAFAFVGHKNSVFRIHKDVLYYPVFQPSSSGCQIAAYDLKNKKELWKKSVKGIGEVLHSAYSNLITLDVNDDVVIIHGHEGFGDYIEFLDTRTGKTLGHKTFNMKFPRREN